MKNNTSNSDDNTIIERLLLIPAESRLIEFKRLAGDKIVSKIVETLD